MAFYNEGLNFECKFCGECCRIKEGYVWISRKDQERLMDETGLCRREFRRLYVDIVDRFVVLKSFPNGDCIFFDEEIGCKVYSARPLQCRTFPFWPDNLSSAETWRKTSQFCPGIGSGRLFSKDDVEARLSAMRGDIYLEESNED